MPIPVIDLFAGPGGLGEGFSSLTLSNKRAFQIKLSIETDEYAHRTLELRAFYREFLLGDVPGDFYDYLAGRITREALFSRHPDASRNATNEAWRATLGDKSVPSALLDDRIAGAVGADDLWVLIGGPPCQAYSLVGRSRLTGAGKEGRERGAEQLDEILRIVKAKRKKFEADPRHLLYEHYLRIIAIHRPPVFVMENVKGLLSATLKKQRIFERILSDLRRPLDAVAMASDRLDRKNLEYRLLPLAAGRADLMGQFAPEDFILRAEDYGIPQARHRVIILGIRSDLTAQPGGLAVASEKATVEQVLGDLPRLRSGLSKEADTPAAWCEVVREIAKAKWLNDRGVPRQVSEGIVKAVCHVHGDLNRGANFLAGSTIPHRDFAWYYDGRLDGVCNHESRGHIRSDLHRYFFAAVFARKMGRSPLLEDFPEVLRPNHKNVEDALKETKFNDRFRVQLAGRPATTVVSHIAKDGHYYIHYDPSQCRSLTVREAARLQTFPDNYFFEGPRTEQYKQVGNAVPPLLARQIGEIIAGFFGGL